MFCGNCGAKIAQGEKFCGECGAEIAESEHNVVDKSDNCVKEKSNSTPINRTSLIIGIPIVILLFILLCLGLDYVQRQAKYNDAMQKYEQELESYEDKLKATSAYKSLISQDGVDSYALYDFDRDGLKEIIICPYCSTSGNGWSMVSRSKTGVAGYPEWECDVYTYKDSQTKLLGTFDVNGHEERDTETDLYYTFIDYAGDFIINTISAVDDDDNVTQRAFKKVTVSNNTLQISEFENSSFHVNEDGGYSYRGNEIKGYLKTEVTPLNDVVTQSEPVAPKF